MQGNVNIPDSTITTNLSFRQLVLMNMQQLTNFPYIEKDFDALTDYELLCLVVKFLNDVIANQNEQNNSITRMYQSFLALQDYVNNTKDTLEDAFNELDDYVRNYFDNLDVQDEINNKLDQMAEDGTLERIIADYILENDSNQITVDDNLLTNDSLWLTNNGWNGNYSTGFSHILNETEDLEYNYDFAANKTYIVDFDVTTSLPSGQDNASNDFTVVLGDTQPIITYRGGGSMHYTIALRPSTAGHLKFLCVSHSDPYTPSGNFDGTISNITLKESSGNLEPFAIKDANQNNSLCFSVMLSDNDSVAIGKDAGITNYSQSNNVYIGKNSGKTDTTGYFNTGVGANTIANSINSSRNTGVGYSALANMISGDRNIGLGTFAMSGNRYGRKNIAIGYDTMMTLQRGNENIAIGGAALISVSNVSNQIAIGPMAMGGSTHTGDTPNIAIGRVALWYNTTGSNNIGIGANSLYKNTTGEHNIAIGMTALSQNQTSSNNIAIGNSSLGGYSLTGNSNIGIGKTALYYTTSGSGNVALGNNSVYKNTTGNNNIGIGNSALNYAETVSGLIGIGSNAANRVTSGGYSVIIGSDMNQGNLAKAERSVAVGSVNLLNMTELTNSVIMGYNINADTNHTALQNVIAINTGRRALSITRDNYINIANTIYADTFTVGKEKVGIGVSSPNAWLHLPASTVDGGTAPLKLTAGTLMGSPENGAFEFDGTHLYFTIGSTRKTII